MPRGVKIGLGILAGLLLLLFVAYGTLQTTVAKNWLAGEITKLASNADSGVKISGISGHLPWNVAIDRVELTDRDGVWLTIDQAKLDWNPLAAAAGVYDIDLLEAKAVTLLRQPIATAKPEEPASNGFSIPIIRLGALRLDRVAIPAEITGGAPLTLKAIASSTGDHRFKGQVTTLEGTPTELVFDADVHAPYQVKATLNEAPGGLLATLAGLPLDRPLTGTVQVTGVEADISGTLLLQQKSDTLAKLAFRQKETQFTVSGNGTLPQAIADAAHLPARDWTLAVEAKQDGTRWTLMNTSATMAGADVTVSGTVDTDGPEFDDFAVRLQTDDLTPWRKLVGQEIAGDIVLDLHLTGPLDEAAVTLAVQSNALTVQGNQLSDVQSNTQVTTDLQQWIDAGWAEADITTAATLARTGQKFVTDAHILLTEDKVAEIESVHAETPWATVDGSASYALEGGTINADVTTRGTDLGTLTGSVRGIADLAIDAKGTAEDLTLAIDGNVNKLAGLPQPVAGWMADTAKLKAKVNYRPERVAITALSLASGTATLTGEGEYPLQGDEPAPVKLNLARTGYEPVSLEASVLAKPEKITVPAYALSLTGVEASGDIALDLKTTRAAGKTRLAASDLRALGAWLEMPLRGAVDGAITLIDAGGRQGAAVAATATGIALPDQKVTLASAVVDMTIADVARPWLATGTMRLADAAAPGLTVETARASLTPNGENTVVTFSADGAQGGNGFTISGAGSTRVAGERSDVTLTRLLGVFANYPFALQQPAHLAIAPGTVALDTVKMKIADGRLTAAAQMTPQSVTATAKLTRLPLRPLIASRFPSAPDSRIGTDLSISGTPQAPQVAMQADLNIDPLLKGLDRARVMMDGHWRNQKDSGQIDATVKLSSGGDLGGGSVRLPGHLSLQPFAVVLADSAPLSGSFAFDLLMERLDPILNPIGHELRGTLNAKVGIGGTLAKPVTDGKVLWQTGSYNSLRYGLCLNDATLNAAFDGRRIAINQFTGTGEKKRGRLNGKGAIDLEAGRIDTSLNLDQLALFCGGYATGGIDGDLAVRGAFTDMLAKGNIAIGPLAIQLPGGGPDTIPQVQTFRKQKLEEEARLQKQDSVIKIDIDVKAEDRVFVRGRGLEAEFEGALDITGTAAKPHIAGQMSTKRGFFDLLGSRLEISKGVLKFLGGDPKKPYLDLTASSDVDGVVVELGLVGPATKPALSLSSDPALPQDEILARLLFGAPLSNLTPFQAIQLAQAAATLSGESSGPGVLGNARNLLGVDTLSVNQNKSGDTAVEAGKYVTDRVFVGVEQGATPESRKVKTEVEITPTITGETTTDAQGRPGASVEFRYDY